MRRAVFLDRDGVLNEAVVRDGRPYAPLTLEEFRIVPEAAEAVARLKAAGLTCLVFTNQPEIARGLLAPETLEEMHRRLQERVPVDGILVCPHDPTEECDCYKPRPGMLLEAARRWDVSLPDSFVVGDRWRDVGAGKAVGCFSILLSRPYSLCPDPDASVKRLMEAADLILYRLGEPSR